MIYGIVVVTYNRLNLLKVCIEHIKQQTRKYDKVIIIDNCSTDGTKDYLEQLDDICVNSLAQNLGGAGGFSAGVRTAQQIGCDWVTLIDDDAILDKDYLKNLMAWQRIHSDVKAMCGIVYTRNKIALSYARRLKKSKDDYQIHVWNVPRSEYAKEYFLCDMATFCGITFHVGLIKEIGYPDEGYFISFDDTEYTLRMRDRTSIALVTKAVIDHRSGSGGGRWKLYYVVRNEIYTIKKHFGYRFAWEITKQRINQINQFINDNEIVKKRKAMIWAGIIDAWLGRLGKHKKFSP